MANQVNGHAHAARPTPVKATWSRQRYGIACGLAAILWTGAYLGVEPLARLLTRRVAGLAEDSSAASALEFFFYDTGKILLLLLLMVYGIGWLRAGLDVERVRAALSGKRRLMGYALGAGFGAVTPFCSCSSIPLFLGCSTAGIPMGSPSPFHYLAADQ